MATPHSVDIHRREARIAAALPADVSAPRLRWSFDDGDWVVLAFDFVAGHTPELPWRSDDLDRVLAAMVELAGALTPSPIATETAEDVFGDALRQWRTFPDDPGDLARLAPPWQRRLDELVELESRWSEVDPRFEPAPPRRARRQPAAHRRTACASPTGHGRRPGAPWLDLRRVPPERRHAGRTRSRIRVARAPVEYATSTTRRSTALVAAFAGFLTRNALRPPPPSLPTLPRVPGGAGRHRTGLARATTGLDRRARLLTPRAARGRQLAMPSSCGSATGRSRTSPTARSATSSVARTADEDVHERDGRERDTDPHRGVPSVHERLARRVRDRRAVASERGGRGKRRADAFLHARTRGRTAACSRRSRRRSGSRRSAPSRAGRCRRRRRARGPCRSAPTRRPASPPAATR